MVHKGHSTEVSWGDERADPLVESQSKGHSCIYWAKTELCFAWYIFLEAELKVNEQEQLVGAGKNCLAVERASCSSKGS